MLVACALAVSLVGKYAFTRYGLALSVADIVWPQVVSGFGLGLLATPLAVAAYDTLAKPQTEHASSLFVLATQLGTALGVAGLDTVLDAL